MLSYSNIIEHSFITAIFKSIDEQQKYWINTQIILFLIQSVVVMWIKQQFIVSASILLI